MSRWAGWVVLCISNFYNICKPLDILCSLIICDIIQLTRLYIFIHGTQIFLMYFSLNIFIKTIGILMIALDQLSIQS